MDPSVKAALISGSVALAVAVIGVIATGVAQVRGSKTANANALALFKRQDDKQADIRFKEAMERRRTAFLTERRAVYARFLLAKRHFEDDKTKIQELKKRHQTVRAEYAGSPRPDAKRLAELVAELDAASPKIDAAYDKQKESQDDVALTLQEMFMLAPLDVVNAAADWHNAKEGNDPQLQANFLNAARADVGAEPLARLPVL
jgi:hypothetical protein